MVFVDEVVLPDTTLCAIVRDEMENPSGQNPPGAIVDFVDSTVPFVEEAVIVDALSKDGTREALEELQAKYPHLQVFDRQFTDYADQRNYSLDQARTRNVFILDADERLTREDFVRLREIMLVSDAWGYIFDFLYITPENPKGKREGGNKLRLFQQSKETRYRNSIIEYLYLRESIPGYYGDAGVKITDTGIKIKHFLPNEQDYETKNTHWYCGVVSAGKASLVGPHDVPESRIWKKYNPARENFR